ncbi:MAG: hypothetical protein OEV66_00355 [Spirochaetia bacterium]|nr:hypothetical protein [Spirochaetia bacterium]
MRSTWKRIQFTPEWPSYPSTRMELCMTIDHKNGLFSNDPMDILAAIKKITGGQKAAILGSSVHFRIPSRDVRIFAASTENARDIKAASSVITNPAARISANFFMKVNKPPFPFKFFSTEKEALGWLKQYIQ